MTNVKINGKPHQQQVRFTGIVERITFHNAENGWSVLKVSPFQESMKRVTVVIHQAKVFAGSSMEFFGVWIQHPKHGEQFQAEKAIEKKPASTAAIEKYLGSGLIKGVGPQTAHKIVHFFKEKTLEIFENHMDDLLGIPGISVKKLVHIQNSWQEHQSIRDVMMFLQGYGISTLFAVKIYKSYGKRAIEIVSQNPYRLAKDIVGIGFFSADKIALNMGFEPEGHLRLEAGIQHVLSAAREEGHCYLTEDQIVEKTLELLAVIDHSGVEKIRILLDSLWQKNEIKKRLLPSSGQCTQKSIAIAAFYSNSLYFDEQFVATRIQQAMTQSMGRDASRIQKWVEGYCQKYEMHLSPEQQQSIIGMAGHAFSILTGGPGCGKTTTTRVLVKLLCAMNQKVVLAAPTGRAAQRMTEVMGREAKTIHRLLEWAPEKSGFKRSPSNPLDLDFLIIDECSMLDIHLAAALLKAVPLNAQILWIGDPDQLPSVGAGNVLQDLLSVPSIPSYCLTKVFRQAEESLIIRFAHEINQGKIPRIQSPLEQPQLWKDKVDCLFMDAEEATGEQIRFLQKAKLAIERTVVSGQSQPIQVGESVTGLMKRQGDTIQVDPFLIQEFENSSDIHAPIFVIPEKLKHVDLEKLHQAPSDLQKFQSILKSVHPCSALHYGMSALDVVLRMYTKTIPESFGKEIEIQVLTPQVRGSLGTVNLNARLQAVVNPERNGVTSIQIGDRLYREGDRVIQTRNNYDLKVYNGDIGRIQRIDLDNDCCFIQFGKHTPVRYEKESLSEIALAYGITIHKSQGSEFDAVIIPIATQHFKMLFRNLIYTGLTRAKKLCVFVGSRKALAMAVKQVDQRKRQTALAFLINSHSDLSD